MHTVPPNADNRVLVTGANGYIAMWIIQILLDQGYSVRGAIRSEEKGRHAKEYFAKYGDRVDWAIVPDITKACSGTLYTVHSNTDFGSRKAHSTKP